MTGLASWLDAGRMRPSGPKRGWVVTLIFGIGALLFGLHLEQLFPQTGYAIDPAYGPPVIAFEFAGSQADLIAIFGPDSDALQVSRLATMRTGNEQDYLYMLLYAGFLTAGCLTLWRELRLRPLVVAAALPLFAALCDAWENWLLFDIQAAFTAGDYSPAMASLPYPVAAKFLLLAATNVVIGGAIAQIGRRWTLVGTLAVVATVAVPMAVAMPADYGWTLIAAIGGGWIVLLGTAAIGSWYALVKGRPLADFDAAPAPAPPSPQPARKSFGRRKP